MKKFQFVLMMLTVGSLLSLSSCLKKDYATPPDLSGYDPMLPVNMTINQLKSKMPTSGNPKLIDSNWTIYGIVTADDRSGNFYKQINIQDSTGGITLLINANSLYTKYPVGRKMYVKLQGLYYGFYGGLPQVGVMNAGIMEQIPGTSVDNYIVRANFPNPVNSDTVAFSALVTANAAYYNKLVTLKDVEFEDNELGKTYADNPNTASQSGADRYIHSCSGTGSINVRSSNYANFRDKKLPGGKGIITGIYTVYNGKPQFLIRDTTDVNFKSLRCDGSSGNYFFRETFNNEVSGDINLTGWLNLTTAGTQKWKYSNSGSTTNPYARISAFNTGEPSVISWLITPSIDLSATANPKLTFRTLSGFDNGATLEVFYTTNYTGDVATTTWTLLPAAISHNPNGFSGIAWTNSGALTLPSGANVRIAFKYAGGDAAKTTTYELDDVKIIAD